MKTLTITLLVLSMSVATIMTATTFAAEEKPEATTSSETQAGHAHRQKMDTHMKMMHENGDHGMMGMMHGKKHKGMEGKTGEMSKKEHANGKLDEHTRMQHMEHRMDTMQMMMEQMMQHEDAMHQHSKH